MIPKECKRLAEVDFPIAEVSRHAVREKSLRRGHPSTLHLWWARRPLASSRAMLLALLLPDPCDPRCPKAFREKARRILLAMPARPRGWEAEVASDEGLRRIILKFIADFADWENAASTGYLATSRALVKAAHAGEPPLVADPFAGGGSIPLEALRLGCEAFASDLNPVACLILKVMLEDIPRHGPGLAKELRKAGEEIKKKAERALADLYPPDPDGAKPIAYLWARTVRCEAPNCGAEIPLMRSFWLRKKDTRKRALRHRVVRTTEGAPPQVAFEVFDPKEDDEVRGGTVNRARATCLCCGVVLPPARVRAQLAAQRGGADAIFAGGGGGGGGASNRRIGGARITAVVTRRPGQKTGRDYRLPTDADYAAVRRAQERVTNVLAEWEAGGKQGLRPVPDEPLPLMSGTFNVPLYGMTAWGDLFTARQKAALVELGRLCRDESSDTRPIVHAAIGMCVDKVAMRNSSGCRWNPSGASSVDMFGLQALPIVWDFAESSLACGSKGDFQSQMEWLAKILDSSLINSSAQVQQADATDHPLPDQAAGVWFTDPPYYYAIPYADLSDFFYVWLKRTLPEHPLLRDLFNPDNPLTPKDRELCEMARWDPKRYPHKNKQFFEDGMAQAFIQGRRVLQEDGVGAVVFAHKTTDGWEALLSGLIRGGWTLTASWPVATENPTRLRALNSATLATSVHLVCRPRPEDAPVGEWGDVLRALPRRVSAWMERLQGEGVRGADLVFACVGPALEIYSRHRAVETAEGREVDLPEYLEKVWEVVGRAALRQVLGATEAGALEEDARLTALFLWTLQSTETAAEDDKKEEEEDEEAVAKAAARGFRLPFDVVRRFAQPMGIDLALWNGRIIDQKKGAVRLLPVAERAKELFGEDGASAAASRLEREPNAQMALFPEAADSAAPRVKSRSRGGGSARGGDPELQDTGATTLDRAHAAMLLQDSGHANALRALIVAEQNRGTEFLRLANALSALYPRGSQEKRLLDAMLLAVPR